METNRKELINILVPDYQDAIYQINNLTDEEIDIIFEYGEIYGFPLLSDLKYDLYTYIQDKIIKSLIESEFIDKKDAYKFYDEYNEDIYDFCTNDEFISREYPGTYYIYVDERRSFVERIFEDNDDEFSNWAPKIKKNINYLEIVNELNKNFDGLKFII
jgi:intein/homing endonuclease